MVVWTTSGGHNALRDSTEDYTTIYLAGVWLIAQSKATSIMWWMDGEFGCISEP